MPGETENGLKLPVTSCYLQSYEVFNCRPFPNSLKYRDHQETFQQYKKHNSFNISRYL